MGKWKIVDWKPKSGGLEMERLWIANGKVVNWKWECIGLEMGK